MAITYSELRMPTLDFAGKTAVVTGAGRGIGRAIALTLAHYGANVVCSSRSKEQCDETVGIIKSHGGSALTVTADVSSRADAENLIAKALEEYGKVDILVNNAGYSGTPTPFEELPDEQWNRAVETNLNGTYYCSQAVVESMKENGGGKIFNIASISGKVGMRGLAHYSATKAGILAFTKSLAGELAKYGITVNAICPGNVETDINRDMLALPEVRKELLKYYPMGRFGTEWEIAGPVAFLASDSCRFVTGIHLSVDGGFQTCNPYTY